MADFVYERDGAVPKLGSTLRLDRQWSEACYRGMSWERGRRYNHDQCGVNGQALKLKLCSYSDGGALRQAAAYKLGLDASKNDTSQVPRKCL